jgi:hypothetical protein
MQPSRRGYLSATGAAVVSLLSGCTASGGLTDPSAGQSSSSEPDPSGTSESDPSGTSKADPSFEARLTGPETDRRLFGGTDVATVGELKEGRGSYMLPITLRESAATGVSETFRTAGVEDDPDAFEIVLFEEGEEIDRFGVAASIAHEIAAGEWGGEFVLSVENRDRAVELRELLAE